MKELFLAASVMTVAVNVHEARTRLFRLPEQARSVRKIILVKAGKPCVRLMPFAKGQNRRKPTRLSQAFFESFPTEELDVWVSRWDATFTRHPCSASVVR